MTKLLAQTGASKDLDIRTVAIGMAFFHELGHTVIGGIHPDPVAGNYDPGENEIIPNQIRSEMGAEWGER
jgi:hypothetical protein